MKTLSLVLASLLLLQACAGSVSRRSVGANTVGEPGVIQASAPGEDSVPEKPKRRWWPWVVGGVAVAAVVTATLIIVAIANFEGPGIGDFDVGFGGSGSNDRDRKEDDGQTVPVIASR